MRRAISWKHACPSVVPFCDAYRDYSLRHAAHTEVINIFALAIRKGLTAEDLKTTMFAYPTGASDINYMV